MSCTKTSVRLVQFVETEEGWQKLARETAESLRATLIEQGMGHLIPSEEESKKAVKKRLANIKRKFRALERLRERH